MLSPHRILSPHRTLSPHKILLLETELSPQALPIVPSKWFDDTLREPYRAAPAVDQVTCWAVVAEAALVRLT